MVRIVTRGEQWQGLAGSLLQDLLCRLHNEGTDYVIERVN